MTWTRERFDEELRLTVGSTSAVIDLYRRYLNAIWEERDRATALAAAAAAGRDTAIADQKTTNEALRTVKERLRQAEAERDALIVQQQPAEPEPGCWRIGSVDVVRIPTTDGEHTHPDGDDWFVPSIGRWFHWGALWHDIGFDGCPIRRLVPAPEPVTLPWSGLSIFDTEVCVAAVQQIVRLRVGTGYVADMDPDVGRSVAAALLSAADQAEAAP